MIQRDAGDTECENVTLNKRRRNKGPRVDDGQLRHQRQVGDDDVGVGGPLSISDRGAEEGLAEKRDEEDARHRRDIYSGRHLGRSIWVQSLRRFW